MSKPAQKPALDWCFSFFSYEKSSYKQLPSPRTWFKRACLLFLLSFHLCQREGSVDERQKRRERERDEERGREREEVWGVALCRSFLAGASQENRARLIIIKTHTTWHVYLMAAPGKDGKLLLSLTVTCWSTTVPCVSARVCVCVCVCVWERRRLSVCVGINLSVCAFNFL